MNSLVSILMCVYNTPLAYFRQAVDSMLDQSYAPCEIIIVDDGSDDPELLDYIDKLEKTHNSVTVVRNKGNLGLTKSLNIGLSHCKGEYIARMDADDISLPDRIAKEAEYLERHPEVSLVGGGIIIFGNVGEKETLLCNYCDDPEIYRIQSLLRHSGPPHPTFMFRADYLCANGLKYREDILKAQDYGIMADILKTGGQIRVIEEPLLRYRVHSGQITSFSEVEQKAYQCRVSYDYLKSLFPILSESECAAVSLLGCPVSWNRLVETINSNNELKRACSFITDNVHSLRKPKDLVAGVKKLLMYNNRIGLFDREKLEAEFRYELWKKSLRMSKYLRKIWSLDIYTLMSYRYVIKRRRQKRCQ